MFYDPRAPANPGVDCDIRKQNLHTYCVLYQIYSKVAKIILYTESDLLKVCQLEVTNPIQSQVLVTAKLMAFLSSPLLLSNILYIRLLAMSEVGCACG